MDKDTFKFISEEELRAYKDPIVFVITAGMLEGLASNFVEGDREFTDIELNRIAKASWFVDEFDMAVDDSICSMLEAVFKKDNDWAETDKEYLMKQQQVPPTDHIGSKAD